MQSALGVSMIAFGGFSWALDGSAAPVAAVLRLEPAMRPAGALDPRSSKSLFQSRVMDGVGNRSEPRTQGTRLFSQTGRVPTVGATNGAAKK